MTETDIRRTSADEIFSAPNAQSLMEEYGNESAVPHLGRIQPQAATYAKLEESGLFHCFGVFAGAELVGFASLLIAVYPHYNQKVAAVESVFVTPAHRAGSGRRLMVALESYARMHDCIAIQYGAPVDSQLAMVLFASKKCTCTTVTFTKALA